MHKKTALPYRILGNGDPVLFLHGFLESMTMWETLVLEQLPFQSILLDLPGHGKALLSEEKPSMSAMAEQVKSTLEELEIDPLFVVGHSMGGYVALELIQILDKKPHVIFLNSNFWADSELKKKDRERVAEVVKTMKRTFIKEAIPALFADSSAYPSEVQQLIDEASEMSSEAIAWATMAMRDRKDYSAQIQNYRFTFIQGGKDKLIPAEISRSKTTSFPERYFELEHVGHMAHIEAKEDVRVLLQHVISG